DLHSASAAPSPRSWLVPDRRKKSRARQLSEMVSETCWSARDLPIRGRHRQARVAADHVPVAFESLNQLHVLARFQRTEASDPPVRVSPKSQVCTMNMVVMRPVGSVATYMTQRDNRWMVPPFGNVDHTENHVGIGRDLSQQPIRTHSAIGIRGGIPGAEIMHVANRSGVCEANCARRADIARVDGDGVNVRAEVLRYRGAPVAACIEHHD